MALDFQEIFTQKVSALAIDSTIIFTALGAAFGALVGFLSKTYLSRLSFRQKTTELVVTRYLDVRDQICKVLAECATAEAPEMTDAWIEQQRRAISLLYYQYYDFIPKQVIQELIAFQICMSDKQHRLFVVEQDTVSLVEQENLMNFVQEISTLKNICSSLYLNLTSDDKSARQFFRIQYQARHALTTINTYFTETNLTSLNLFGPKR